MHPWERSKGAVRLYLMAFLLTSLGSLIDDHDSIYNYYYSYIVKEGQV